MADPREALTKATAHREATEQLAATLRKNIIAWRAHDAQGNPVKRALLYGAEQLWSGRVDGLATALEEHATTLRTQEAQLVQALAAQPPPAPPAPADAPKPARKPKRR